MKRALFLGLLIYSGAARAYVGPGAGLGALAITLALVLGLVLLLVGLVWYPLKRLIRSKKPTNTDKNTEKR